MQCPNCHAPVETTAGSQENVCPACKAPLSAGSSAAPRARKSRLPLFGVFGTLLLAALATVAAGSTFLAVRTLGERDRAREELGLANALIEKSVMTVASNSQLKAGSMEPARRELLEPVLEYYQALVSAHSSDKKASPEINEALFRIAALQAKLGSKASVESLRDAINYIFEVRKVNLAPEAIPSLQKNLLRITAPTDWMTLKGATPDEFRDHGIGLFIALQIASNVFADLHKKHPESVGVSDDLSALLKSFAMLQAVVPGNSPVNSWIQARDVLEGLVKDVPAETDYKVRLAEALTNVGRLQKSAKKTDEALAAYQRAVEVRQQLLDAKPDDKSLERDLATAKKEVEKLKPAAKDVAAPASQDAAPTEKAAAATTEKEAAPPAAAPPPPSAPAEPSAGQ